MPEQRAVFLCIADLMSTARFVGAACQKRQRRLARSVGWLGLHIAVPNLIFLPSGDVGRPSWISVFCLRAQAHKTRSCLSRCP
mmetsp:Transcript_115046/g.310836  ORF Transcript_115046/g.310836 Transcript_115046/m.310836 type:complete len:83 (+) Transcript_115046:323-571(+)